MVLEMKLGKTTLHSIYICNNSWEEKILENARYSCCIRLQKENFVVLL